MRLSLYIHDVCQNYLNPALKVLLVYINIPYTYEGERQKENRVKNEEEQKNINDKNGRRGNFIERKRMEWKKKSTK